MQNNSVSPQQPSGMPFERYRAFPPIDLPDRTWPSAVITAPPAGSPPTCVTATRPSSTP